MLLYMATTKKDTVIKSRQAKEKDTDNGKGGPLTENEDTTTKHDSSSKILSHTFLTSQFLHMNQVCYMAWI
jgi:hypothetical protein